MRDGGCKMGKWIHAAIPALLLHCSIGSVYCWSTFKTTIAEQIGMSSFAVGWAFSLAIFFLGMSAAFMGKLVEKNIHKSSLISCICFTSGMIGTGISINFLTGIPALIMIFICYGGIMGVGLGVGYLTPVKTLMLWFKDNKGLATGISIMGFGLAKAIATPIMEAIQTNLGIAPMFYILGGIYFAAMFIGHLMLKKPEGWIEEETESFNIKAMFKDKIFLGIWLMFFLNIHCGLMLISYEKQILQTVFVGLAILGVMVSVIPSISSAFNALGRIGYSSLSDKLKQRNSIYKIIFISCIGICLLSLLSGNAIIGIIMIILLFVTNAGYGGGFSTLPALLSERFGMKRISKIHGLALSAWAIAGLTGNNMSELILNAAGHTIVGYKWIILAMLILYSIALVICWIMVGKKKSD